MKKSEKLTNNIGLKILAVAVSVLLWLISMSINDPVEEQTFRNIRVEMENTHLLTDSGKVWEVLDETDYVNVRVRANRSVLDSIRSSDISAVADFREMSLTNAVPIEVSINRYAGNQIQELDSNVDNLKLDVENLVEKQLVIEVNQKGKPAEGYIVSRVATTDGNAMRISGPESLISTVTKAVTEVEVTNLTDNINITERIHLLDAEGKEVSSSRISRSVTTSNISVTILATKEVPLTFRYSGTPEEGYAATGELEFAPERIKIAGKSSVLSAVEQVNIPESELNLNGVTADLVKLVDVRSHLPEGVSLITGGPDGFNGKASVTVKVEELKEMTIPVNKANIQLLSVPDGYTVEPETSGRMPVRILGLQRDLDALDVTAVTGTADVAAWMEENGLTADDLLNLEEGAAELEVTVVLPEEIEQVSNVMLPVRIAKTEENTTE